MKKTTRKSFSRKAIVVVMCVFLTVSLAAVGFASWLISNDASTKGTGNVNASNVSDAILGVTIKNAENLGKINFGPLESDKTGNIRYNDATPEEANDKESLTITVSGSIKKFATLKQMEVKIKVPDSVITAAGYKATDVGEGVKTYTVDPALPKYITLPAGAADTNGNLIVADSAVVYASDNAVFKPGADDTATFSFDVTFGWGALFEGKNPGRYLDGEDGTLSEENKNALLAIINVGKDENSKYKTLKAQGDADAKRDILTAMKKAIAASETKFTVVVNAQAK